jgi:uncharacterized protein (DUF2236 family)
MLVTRDELERSIARLRAEVVDPRAGLYGPGSISWTVDRELCSFMAGGRAALLQLAHPSVAHAVDQHSHTRADPFGRFQRTFKHVFAMVFGDLDHAIASARRVHAIHERIYGVTDDGTRYQANEPNALFWVHATLVDSALCAFELIVRPLSQRERDGYLRESHRFALLFGIPEDLLPESWSAFESYNRRMWRTLRVTAPAAEMAHFLLDAPITALVPVAAWYRMLTAGLLPAELREPFGLRFGRADQLAFDATLPTIRAVYRRLPPRMRQVPAYSHALRRLRGEPGPDPFAARLEKLMLDTPLGRREPAHRGGGPGGGSPGGGRSY